MWWLDCNINAVTLQYTKYLKPLTRSFFGILSAGALVPRSNASKKSVQPGMDLESTNLKVENLRNFTGRLVLWCMAYEKGKVDVELGS